MTISEERAAGVDASRVARALELRQQLAGAHDRAGDEVREERQVHGEPRNDAGTSSRRYVSTTYEIAMNVKKEMPTGSATLTIHDASSPSRERLSVELTRKPAYLK